jgi:hypothetical protein
VPFDLATDEYLRHISGEVEKAVRCANMEVAFFMNRLDEINNIQVNSELVDEVINDHSGFCDRFCGKE